ncbi:hypothetical protein BDY24DRAFT_411357 [Mrakia frigida]|uniref:uncharacterized protein n=1 Tax=Mrakia frigida TaxID=29902 RepID=UPI003FCBF591
MVPASEMKSKGTYGSHRTKFKFETHDALTRLAFAYETLALLSPTSSSSKPSLFKDVIKQFPPLPSTVSASDRFQDHVGRLIAQGNSAAHGLYGQRQHLGGLTAAEQRTLTKGLLDPTVSFGACVVLGSSHLRDLEQAHQNYLRQILSLSRTSHLPPIYLLTGILPLRSRYLQLSLRYLQHLASSPPSTFVHQALLDSMKLRRASGWYATVLREMGRMGLELPGTVEELAEFEWVEEMVGKMHDREENASRTRAISNDLLPFLHPVNFPPSTSLQHLYYISNQSHQQTLLRFISGHSDLRVVVLGRTRREEEKVPRRERVCRHGCGEIEDEAHLMRCEHAGIVALRAVMLEQAKEVGWDENERRGADEEDGNRGNDELGDMDEASFVISEPYAYDPFTIISPSPVDHERSTPRRSQQPSRSPGIGKGRELFKERYREGLEGLGLLRFVV